MVFLGPPGAGKGTQAELLREHYGIVHISTGDMIRERIAAATPTGLKAKPFAERGALVPDAIMVEMVTERLGEPDCSPGFLLDGFPRTRGQAEALDPALAATGRTLDAVVLMEVADEEVVQRLSGRRTCRRCHHSCNVVSLPPRVAGACDRCGGELFQRQDDRPETIRNRLDAYHKQTEEVVPYYETKGMVRRVSAVGSVDEIQQSIRDALHEFQG